MSSSSMPNNSDVSGVQNEATTGKGKSFRSMRYVIITIALFSPLTVTFSKQMINFTILEMVQRKPQTNHFNETLRDGSCDFVDEEAFKRWIDKQREKKHDAKEATLNWSPEIEGFIKGSYSFGHIPMQVVGGRTSEIHGSHKVMLICSLLISLSCFLGPKLAQISYLCLIADIAMVGMFSAFMTPGLINLFSNWLTPNEKSISMSLYLVMSRLGSAICSFLCGLVIAYGGNWEYVFYLSGTMSLVFCTIFGLVASNRPQDCKWLSKEELEYIASKNRLVRESLAQRQISSSHQKGPSKIIAASEQTVSRKEKQSQTKSSAPWMQILTNQAVLAFIITKFCVKFAGEMMEKELPNYLTRVLHVTDMVDGILNGVNYVIFCVGCMTSGIAARWVLKRKPFGIDKVTARKMFQASASLGVSFSLITVTLDPCNITMVALGFGCAFFLTTLGAGGESQMPLDLSERYSGTIHALASTIGSTTGFFAPIIVGQINSDGRADWQRWRWIWLTTSIVSAIGAIAFAGFGEAKIQPFDGFASDLDSKNAVRDESQDSEAPELDVITIDRSKTNDPVAGEAQGRDADDKYKESPVI